MLILLSFKISLLLHKCAKKHISKTRSPLNKKMLNKLLINLNQSCLSFYYKPMFYLLYSFMYNAALRVSEVCTSSTPLHVLGYDCITLCKSNKTIQITLRSYKHSNFICILPMFIHYSDNLLEFYFDRYKQLMSSRMDHFQ